MLLYWFVRLANYPLETRLAHLQALVQVVRVFTLYSVLHRRFATPSFLDVARSALFHVTLVWAGIL